MAAAASSSSSSSSGKKGTCEDYISLIQAEIDSMSKKGPSHMRPGFKRISGWLSSLDSQTKKTENKLAKREAEIKSVESQVKILTEKTMSLGGLITKVREHNEKQRNLRGGGNGAKSNDDEGINRWPGSIPFSFSYNLKNDLERFKAYLAVNGPTPYTALSSRQWVPIPANESKFSPIDKNHRSLSIMSWNMLADGLSGSYYSDKSDSGSTKKFVGVSPLLLEWKYRCLRILEEIARFDCDIVCIQEYDQPILESFLTRMGYTVLAHPKSSSPCLEVGKLLANERGFSDPSQFPMNPDGVLIAWKSDKFEIFGNPKYLDKSESKSGLHALIVPLRTSIEEGIDEESSAAGDDDEKKDPAAADDDKKKSKRKRVACGEFDTNEVKDEMCDLVIACTHLKASKKESGEKIRVAQLTELNSHIDKVNRYNVPVFLCADLNATPSNAIGYDPLAYNYVLDSSRIPQFRSSQRESRSARDLGDTENPYTSYKERPGFEFLDTLDYIFVKNGYYRDMTVVSTMSIPEISKAQGLTIPSASYPSDHFAIASKFIWNVSQPKDACMDTKKGVVGWPLPSMINANMQQKLTKKFDVDFANLKERYKGRFRELTPRFWKSINQKVSGLSRTYSSEEIQDRSVNILQFNMLATGLTGAYEKENDAKSFLGTPKECIRMDYRGLRIVEIIMKHNTDILCMQECDEQIFLDDYLTNGLGYQVEFVEKYNSPIARKVSAKIAKVRGHEASENPFPLRNDGLLMAFKKESFKFCGDIQRITSKDDGNEVGLTAMILPLQSTKIMEKVTQEDGSVIKKGVEFLLISCHLKSSKNAKGERIRVEQMQYLYEKLDNPRKLPIIMACDLNANPVVNKNGYSPDCYKTIRNDLKFDSAYSMAYAGEEPSYTTYKLRTHGVDKHCIDYIFLRDGKWKVSRILEMPEIDDDDMTQLIPNWAYPSDHYALACNLVWD